MRLSALRSACSCLRWIAVFIVCWLCSEAAVTSEKSAESSAQFQPRSSVLILPYASDVTSTWSNKTKNITSDGSNSTKIALEMLRDDPRLGDTENSTTTHNVTNHHQKKSHSKRVSRRHRGVSFVTDSEETAAASSTQHKGRLKKKYRKLYQDPFVNLPPKRRYHSFSHGPSELLDTRIETLRNAVSRLRGLHVDVGAVTMSDTGRLVAEHYWVLRNIDKLINRAKEQAAHPTGKSVVVKGSHHHTTLKDEDEEKKMSRIPSEPFFSHQGGYLLQMEFVPWSLSVPGSAEIYIKVLHGEFDNRLDWPVPYSFDVSLIDQSMGSVRRDHVIRSNHCLAQYTHPVGQSTTAQEATNPTTSCGVWIGHWVLNTRHYKRDGNIIVKIAINLT